MIAHMNIEIINFNHKTSKTLLGSKFFFLPDVKWKTLQNILQDFFTKSCITHIVL